MGEGERGLVSGEGDGRDREREREEGITREGCWIGRGREREMERLERMEGVEGGREVVVGRKREG